MTILTASHISKYFGAVGVLNDINLTFSPGSVSALVGDNGAGKSTFLKIVAGVHQPDSGKITLGGEDLTKCATGQHRRAGIEMVHQDFALAKRQSVVANLFAGREKMVAGGLLRLKVMKEEASSILAQLGIHIPNLDLPVGLLSGGQQQAVAIARGVLFNPQVLLLDEPTAALAAREVEKTLEVILQQRECGRIVVLVSHRLNDVFAVADRIVVLKHGRVFSDDTRSALSLSEVVERIVS